MIFCFTSWHIHDSILSSFNSGFSCVCKGIAAAQVLIWVGLCGHKLPASSLSIHSNTNRTEEHPLRCLIHNRPQGSLSVHRLDYVCVCVVSLLLSALLKFHFNCGSSTTPLPPLICCRCCMSLVSYCTLCLRVLVVTCL